MADPVQVVAKIAEQGGAAGTVVAWLAWMNSNSGAVVAGCALAGLAVSGCGFLVGWYYRHQAHKYQLRVKQRRRMP